jgi:hypothetical protein
MMQCTPQRTGQVGCNSRIGIFVRQGQLNLRAERVAREELKMPQPDQGMLSDDIVPFLDLRPLSVNLRQADKDSRGALVWTSRQDHVVAGFEFSAGCWVGFQRTS